MRYKKTAVALASVAMFAVGAQSAHAGWLSKILKPVSVVVAPVLGSVVAAPAATAIEGQYIVVFKDGGALGGLIDAATSLVGGTVIGQLPIINAAVMQLDALSARILAGSPLVDYVEQDQWMSAGASQVNATWGLDRSDQDNRPLDGLYNYPDNAGAGANVYVIDTGLLSGHVDFAGRVGGGRNFVANGAGGAALPIPILGPILGGLLGGLLGGGGGVEADPENFTDCNGHGTHVSGTAAGSTYGIAKGATVYGVRVLGCDGGGANSGVIAGVEWVANNHVAPAVANMSLGGGNSTALDAAVRAAVDQGVVMVVAAGNDNANACNGSPNRVAEAITVGSTDNQDRRSSFSNFGTCVDLFAPGSNITSAWHTGNNAINTISGTSMASPHVAGAVALLIGSGAPVSAAVDSIVGGATPGVLTGVGAGSPNLLLRTLD